MSETTPATRANAASAGGSVQYPHRRAARRRAWRRGHRDRVLLAARGPVVHRCVPIRPADRRRAVPRRRHAGAGAAAHRGERGRGGRGARWLTGGDLISQPIRKAEDPMRKIINSTYISLDGVIERLHDWQPSVGPRGDTGDEIQTELLLGCDALIMGRRTYDCSPRSGRPARATRPAITSTQCASTSSRRRSQTRSGPTRR
jgi:hypothetical protein